MSLRVTVQGKGAIHRSGVAACAALLVAVAVPGPAAGDQSADVDSLTGFAYGVTTTGFPVNLSPLPSAALPPGVTNSMASLSVPPPASVSTGSLSASAMPDIVRADVATSSTSIANLSTHGVFTATVTTSQCTAAPEGSYGITSIVVGKLRVSEGDPNVAGDEVFVNLPTNPAPNTTYHGSIESTGATFDYIFNEQIADPDGSLAVNGGRLHVVGPSLNAQIIWGHAECGVPDTAPPETSIDSGPSGTSAPGPVAFTFSSSQVGSTFQCKLDGPGATVGAYAACTSPKGYAALAEGAYVFSVRATDASNNTDQSAATRSFTLATPTTTPPVVTPPATPPSPPCIVPKTKAGMTLAKVKKKLKAAHCTPGKVKRVDSKIPRGRLVRLTKRAGKVLPAGARVGIVISNG